MSAPDRFPASEHGGRSCSSRTASEAIKHLQARSRQDIRAIPSLAVPPASAYTVVASSLLAAVYRQVARSLCFSRYLDTPLMSS